MAKASVDSVRKVLFTALHALSEYLSDIIVVGGWVPKIYSWTEEGKEPAVHSFDVDAAVPGAIPTRGRTPIAELMEKAGFEKRKVDAGFNFGAFGRKQLPVTQFVYHKGKEEVLVEFIMPLEGKGERDRKTVQGDIIAPALRFTEVLLADTQSVSVRGEALGGKSKTFTFKVPTLPAFVYSKGLIFPRRDTEEKKGKDLAYIFEVLSRPKWNEQVVEGLAPVAAHHPKAWYRTFRRNLETHFVSEGAEGPARIALQYPQRPADTVRRQAYATFTRFLDAIPSALA